MSQNFHSLKVKDIKKETADTVSIAFEIPSEIAGNFNYEAGQYLTFKTNINGEEIRRSYSICSAPYENEMRVAVKQIENGLFSTFANKDLSVGDSLETMSPEGNFKISPQAAETKNYVFYAAGSGITPVLAMVKEILQKDENSSVYLYYGNRTTSETIFKAELDTLADNNQNFNLVYFLSREDSGNENTNGRIDEGKCSFYFDSELKDLVIEGVYSCGPQEMVETVKEFYKNKGLLNKVHFELFTVSAPAKSEAKATPDANINVQSSVTVIIDDEEVTISLATDGKNILQAAQDAGADVPFSCKGGVCCTCKGKVMEGSAKMDLNYALDEEEVEEGFILTCQAHPTSEKLIVSYDEY